MSSYLLDTTLAVRSRQRARKLLVYDDENDHQIIEEEISVIPSKVGLLLIDVWDVSNEGNDSFRIRTERRTREYIVPLLETARKSGMKVFHSPNGGPMTKNIEVLEGEVNLNWLTPYPKKFKILYFYWLAKSMGIETLLIGGYSTAACVFTRPIGILELVKFKGIKLILVRDATHNWEYENYTEGTATKSFIQFLEMDYLPSTTTASINISIQ